MSTSAAPSKTAPTPLVITSFPSIPLTTTFTPPASDCGGVYGPRSPNVFIIDNEPSCLPPNFSTSDSSFFYSPGIACPSGYWTACHDTAGVSSITTVTCCPTYGADISLSCVSSPLLLRGVWETLFCTWIAPASGTAVRVTLSADAGRTSTVAETMSRPGGLNAYGVRMVYQASDLEAAAASSSSSSSSSAPSGAAGSTTAATTNPTGDGSGSGSGSSSPATSDDPAAASSSDSGGGLSTGAKAAIGVVVPLVVIGAVLLGFALWWRRRKRLQDMGPPPPPTALSEAPGSAPPPPGYQFGAVGAAAGHHHQPGEQVQRKQPAEYYYYGGQRQPHEMGADWAPSEMPDTGAAYELPGTMPKGSR